MTRQPSAACVLALAVLTLTPTPAAATWAVNGNPLCATPGTEANSALIPDGAGGAFSAWTDYGLPVSGDYPSATIRVQHVTGLGDIAPGWPANGVRPTGRDPQQYVPQLVEDGQGGVYVAWHDQPLDPSRWDVYLQRLTAAGAVAPGWPADGILVAPVIVPAPAIGSPATITLVSDGANGVLLTWDARVDTTFRVFVQRVGPTGAFAAGWPGYGVAVANTAGHQRTPRSTTDGAGGVIVTWRDGRGTSDDLYAQRVRGDGTIAPGWPAGGAPLCTAAGDQIAYTNECIVPDGSGGAFVAFNDARGADLDVYVQHVTASGMIAASWPADGVPVCNASENQYGASVTPSASGGVFVAWNDERNPPVDMYAPLDIYASKLLADGTLAPGWPTDGLAVCTAERPQIGGEMAGDGAGGVYVAWDDGRGGSYSDIYATRLTSSGTLAPGWTINGNGVCTNSARQANSLVTSDGAGGFIASWNDYRNDVFNADIYAIRIFADGIVPVRISLAGLKAEPSRVAVRWYGEMASVTDLMVQRSERDAEWLQMGIPTVNGNLVEIEDLSVRAGQRYGYRLAWTEDGVQQHGGETWADVPAAPAFALAIQSASLSTGIISFTLPNAEPASLEVFDLSGRSVWRRDVGALGAGRHELSIDQPGRIPAGVHMVRLAQGTAVVVRKAIVLR